MLRYTYVCLVFHDFALVPKVLLTSKPDSTASVVRNKYCPSHYPSFLDRSEPTFVSAEWLDD